MPIEGICCDLTAICAAGRADSAGAVCCASNDGAGGCTNSLMSAVIAGSAFADGMACGVIASLNTEVRRPEEMSMLSLQSSFSCPSITPQRCAKLDLAHNLWR
ncbi:hypothetical protein [Mesorhizobium sp. INR15]|uniref:hypothetical protein n=1 Tax=Mesorhizobium sp. INR15 TaxID=2654248 RepID=UPI0018964C56|nr:hypothetical protein [Mesorhizobium sp. INR15]